jgi:hypothetical protein
MGPQVSSTPLWLDNILASLETQRKVFAPEQLVLVKADEQQLYLVEVGVDARVVHRHYSVSTSRHGLGCRIDSHRTPTGLHRIAEKIGRGEPLGRVFRGRQPQAQIAAPCTEPRAGGTDTITSRILWLEGLEQGFNKGSECDSHDRYIYIHGTPEEGLIGQPASIGCIRMKNADVIDLYDRVEEGTLVMIVP